MTTIRSFRRSPRACAPAALVRNAALLLTGLAVLLLGSTAVRAAGDAIADRPEKLNFPPLTFTPPDAAKYRVALNDDMAAYLVPDKALPMITVVVLMRIGPDLDPPGKEGLAGATVNLLTRSGTAGMTAEQLEERVAFLGAQLESGMGGGRGMMGMGGVPVSGTESRVTLNLLSKDIDEGLKLLTDCLKGCAFQEDRLVLRRDQQLQGLKRRNDESAGIEDYEWNYLTNGEDHWSTRYPTEASLNAVTRDDMVAFQKRYMGPKNFVLAVSGDFDQNTMVKKLQQAFAGWPTKGENPGPPAAPVAPMKTGWYIAEKEVNQTRVSFGLRTIDRYDPDFYAAQVMNFILGGGGFTARLVNRIRSDEGLAYSVGSRFEGNFYYPDLWRVSFQTKARSTAFATQIALTEVKRMREEPVSTTELETAKNSFIEGFPARFPNAAGIAGTLAAEELTGRWKRDPRNLSEYAQRMQAVTVQDVQRVAQRLLDPQKMVFLLVGSGKEIAEPDGKHEVTLSQLAGGEPARIPLRDPLTMKPMP
jgi:zinc protease